jgi:hypothetical protein
VRQYLVLDVKGIAAEQIAQEVGVPDVLVPEKNTVQYNEMTVGISVAF